MIKSNDTIGNRTRGLPACSAVPAATAPPLTHVFPNMTEWKQSFEPVISVGQRTVRRLVCCYLSRHLPQFYPGVSLDEKNVFYICETAVGLKR